MAEMANLDESESQSLADLFARRQERIDRRAKERSKFHIIIPFAIALPPLIPVLFYFHPVVAHPIADILVLAYALGWVLMIPSQHLRLREIDNDIQEIDYHLDLQQFPVGRSEGRAEKILRINNFQLRRYYDLNLRQNMWVLWIGIACIALSAIIIFVSLEMASNTDSKHEQVIIAVLGSVGAILSNVVAAIYLKMNASASRNLTAFHSKLVDTNRLLLANLFVSRIEDQGKQWDTLSKMAIELVGTLPSDSSKPS